MGEAHRYHWCLNCQRVSYSRPWLDGCGTPECDSNILDLFPWADLCAENPDYPKTPTTGDLYEY